MAKKAKTEKVVLTHQTLDGNKYLVKKIGTTFFAISNGKVIASGETKNGVTEAAEKYKSPVVHLTKKQYNIGQLSIFQLSALIDAGEIHPNQITTYYEKHYTEDVAWLKQQVDLTVERFCRAKFFDKTLQLKTSPFWKKLEQTAVDQLGAQDANIMLKYIINPHLSVTELVISQQVNKEIKACN